MVIKPLDLATQMWNDHLRSPTSSSCVPNVNHIWGHVALEVLAHIPSLDEESSGPSFGGSRPMQGAAAAATPRSHVDDASDEDL